MKRRFFFALAFLAAALPAAGQSGNEGTIEGVVRDPSGAAIPYAAIWGLHRETLTAYTTQSDKEGDFQFIVLPVGTYDIRVEQAGFAAAVRQRVELTVGAKIKLDFALAVAGHPETVTVSGATPIVEPTRSSVASTVDAPLIAQLPLNGRNFLSLALLTPAVTAIGNFYSFQGQVAMNSLLVDGADHDGFTQEPVGSLTAIRYGFSQEAVEEFQVNTSTYSAEFGGSAGAIVNVVTKSGTNDLHGVAFWYYRDQGLNATGVINKITQQPKDALHVNQFGGALGGPLVPRKVFFYVNYDGQRRAQQNLVFLNLPSGFALSSNPVTAGYQQTALDYLRARSGSFVRTFNQNVAMAKVDAHLNVNHVLSGRWNGQRFDAENNANTGPQQSLEHTGDLSESTDSMAISLTSVLSPVSTNVARFSYVANQAPIRSNSVNPEAAVFEGGQQVLLVGHAARLPVTNGVRRWEWGDTLSLSRGRNSLKFGGNAVLDYGLFYSGLNFYGSYRFSSLASFGRSLSGGPSPLNSDRYTQAFSALGTAPIDVHPRVAQFSGFAQDEWRVRPSLTLSLGVRYDVQLLNQPSVKNPSPELAAAGIDTSRVVNDGNNLAPRIGFAWAPLPGNRMVVRGGYGLIYPRLLGATSARAFFQNGVTAQTRTLTGTLIPNYPKTICGPPDSSGQAPRCGAPGAGADIIMAFANAYRQPNVQQASLGVEYALRRDLSLSLEFLRSKGTHLQHWQDINLFDPAPATIFMADTGSLARYRLYSSKSRPIRGFDRVLLLSTNASSNYNGMILQATKRFSGNLQFLASYTYSKVLDDAPNVGPVNPGGNDSAFLSDNKAPLLDRGQGDFDQRHRFVFSGTWDLDYARTATRAARILLEGWGVSGIVTAATGTTYSGLVNSDLNGDGNAATDRAPGVGRNTFHLPSTAAVDARIYRRFSLGERAQIQFNVDAFNVFNRANISGVRTTQYALTTCGGGSCLVPQDTGAAAFGTPTEALNARVMQLSARVSF